MTKSNALQSVSEQTERNIYETLALRGNLSQLKSEDKVVYLQKLCESLGLNPLTQPFLPLKLNGKEVLYVSRGATDQLAAKDKLTREIIKTERIDDVYIATCKVTSPDGRFDVSTGAVSIGNLKGDALANALMKAETKAKRRATLCFCGLGFLDESELETIPAHRMEFPRNETAAQTFKDEPQTKPKQMAAPATEAAMNLLQQLKIITDQLNAENDSIVWNKDTVAAYCNEYFDDGKNFKPVKSIRELTEEQQTLIVGDLIVRYEEKKAMQEEGNLAASDADSGDDDAIDAEIF